MDKEILAQKIEAYLLKKMSPEERRTFEQEMASNPELAREVDVRHLAYDAVELMLENDLRAKMQRWNQGAPPAPPAVSPSAKRIPGWWLLLGIGAAGVAVFFYLSRPAQPTAPPVDTHQTSPQVLNELPPADDSFLTQKPPEGKPIPDKKQPPNERRLLAANTYTAHQSAFAPDPQRRGADEQEQANYEQAVELFKKGNYRLALNFLQKTDLSKTETLQLRGHTYFRLNQFEQAADDFQTLTSFSATRMDAQWFLALSYLAQHPREQQRFEEAIRPILEDKEHEWHEKAAKLQEEIARLSRK